MKNLRRSGRSFLYSVAVVCIFLGFHSVYSQDHQQIEEITLEAKEGLTNDLSKPYGPCFRINLHRNGSATFFGKAKVKLIGDFYGTITTAQFDELVKFMTDRNYDQLPDDPVNSDRITLTAGSSRATAYEVFSPWMITTIRFADGHKKQISRPTDLQPLDRKHIPKPLFEIEQAIFDSATHISWSKKS